MERNISTLFQAFMRYGAFFGILQIFCSVLFYFSINPETVRLSTFFSLAFVLYVIPWIGGLFFITKYYRDKECGGYISMPEILQFGAYVALFAGTLTVLYALVFKMYVNNGFDAKLLTTISDKVVFLSKSLEYSQADIDALILQFDSMKESVGRSIGMLDALMAVLQHSFNAVLTMLIFGWFVRKLPPVLPINKTIDVDDN